MTDPLFIPAPFFFIRSCVWPIEKYDAILSQPDWIEAVVNLYDSNAQLQEAILIATPALYQSLQKRPLKDPQKLATSLLNYISRMTTRATPFGLFSFVARGTWATLSEVYLDVHKVDKRLRPDMEWVYSFIYKLYSDKTLLPSLTVRVNPLIQRKSNRYYLDYIRSTDKVFETNKTVSIHASELVAAIFLMAKEPIEVSSLFNKLKSQIPTLDQEKTEVVIEKLLSQQFLLPALLPSLMSDFPFRDLQARLPTSFGLQDIDEKMRKINHLPLGEAVGHLQELQKEMAKLGEAKNYFQIDLAHNHARPTLAREIATEISNGLALLWKISSAQREFSGLNIFHQKFVDRYGLHRTVPLLELLHEEKGLGLLEKYQNETAEDSPFCLEWERWLAFAFQESLHLNKDEIVITEALINQLFARSKQNPPLPEDAIRSIDVFCKMHAKSSDDFKKGNFLISLLQIGWEAGSSTSRFFDLVDIESQNDIKNFLGEEGKLEPHSLFMDLSFWPHSVRSANVVVRPRMMSHSLDIESGTKEGENFSLEDIYVGATFERLYLTLKEGGKEIIPISCNLLNPKFAPSAIQFMREVAYNKYQLIYPFSWGKIEKNASFLPRVRFGNIVLSPAKWYLEGVQFQGKANDFIEREFIQWADRWRLPERCQLMKTDQYLLYDRKHPAHLSEIVKKLRAGETLLFFENIDQAWVAGTDGHYCSEFLFSFQKNPLLAAPRSVTPPAFMPIPFEERWRLPGSDWLYIKFNLHSDEMNRFIAQNLYHFFEHQNLEWFFVRYQEPNPCLRVRARIDEKRFSEILSSLQMASRHWMQEGLIKDFNLACYEREIERYGGIEMIEKAESLFSFDSKATCHILQAILDKKINYKEIILFTLSIWNFLKDCQLHDKKILLLLKQSDRTALKGYNEHKGELIKLLKSFKENEKSELSILREASAIRRPSMLLFQNQKGPADLLQVYDSLVHMHCNRLGCTPTDEKRSRSYLYQTLSALSNR